MVVGGQQQRAIYFLSGHGERSVDLSSPEGYSLLREWLDAENYEVRTLRWPAGGQERAGARRALPPGSAGLLARGRNGGGGAANLGVARQPRPGP